MSKWTLNEKSTGDLTVTVEGKVWEEACKKAFNKIAKDVEVKGFRKGCAPKAILEKEIPAEQAQVTAIYDNANAWLVEAIKEEGLEPISQPTLDIKEVNKDKAELVFTFAVNPEVELGEYKGLSYEVANTEVSEEEFNAELDRMREQFADMEEKDGAAEEGDTVNIDYEGFKDGVAFEGGKAEGFDLTLGSHSFIPGFEDQLIGSKAGEEKELALSFPEDYPAEDLAGAAVIFKVKVNEVKTKVLPEVNDDFAKDINAPGVETAEDLKALVRTRLEDAKKNQAENAAAEGLMNKLAEVTTVEIPDVMVENEVNNKIAEMGQQLQQYGISIEQYFSMMGKKIEDVKEDLKEEAAKSVKIRLALDKVAVEEKLEPTKEAIEEEYQKIADQYQMEVDKVKLYINEEMLKGDLAKQQAFNFIKENAAKVEAKVEAEVEKVEKKTTKKTAAKKTTTKKTAAKKPAAKKTTAKKTTKKAAKEDAE